MIINYVDIVLLVLSILIILVSTQRGLLISLISMLRVFLGVPAAFIISGKYNKLVYDSYIKASVISSLEEKMSKKGGLESLLNEIKSASDSLPEIVKGKLDLSAVGQISTKKAAAHIEAELIRPIGYLVAEIALFLAVLIVIMLVTGIIIHLLKLRNKKDKTPLRRTDMLFGGLFGAVKAVVVVIALSAVASMALDVVPKDYLADAFFVQLKESRIIGTVNQFINQ